jgi:hypothetical protein
MQAAIGFIAKSWSWAGSSAWSRFGSRSMSGSWTKSWSWSSRSWAGYISSRSLSRSLFR